MKKLILFVICIVLLVSRFSIADNIILNDTESVVPEKLAKNIENWHISYLSQADKRCTINFTWTDNIGSPISAEFFDCINHKKEDGTQIENSECTSAGSPYSCCTASNVGVCKCFSDVFGYQLQVGDAGTAIGIKQRNLLWQQAKKKLLSGGNDGSFD